MRCLMSGIAHAESCEPERSPGHLQAHRGKLLQRSWDASGGALTLHSAFTSAVLGITFLDPVFIAAPAPAPLQLVLGLVSFSEMQSS